MLPAFPPCSAGSPVLTRSTAAGRGMCWKAGDVHLRGAFGKDSRLACEGLLPALGKKKLQQTHPTGMSCHCMVRGEGEVFLSALWGLCDLY